MSLGIALKNHSAVVIAADQPIGSQPANRLITLPNRCVVLITGIAPAVHKAIIETALPRAANAKSAAALAQYIHAALVLEVVPHLSQIPGRVEVIIAGIDPIRHVTEPNIYYLDSARDFYLTIGGPAVSTGATAAIPDVLRNRQLENATNEQLISIAKECYAATKLRWPGAVSGGIKLSLITPARLTIHDF